MPNTFVIYVISTLGLIIFTIHRIIDTRKKMLSQLYQGEIVDNKVMVMVEKFVGFSKNYGGVLASLIIVYRLFFGNETIGGESFFSILYTIILDPVVMVIAILFLTGIFRADYIPSYYFNKYYEEYKKEYDIPE